MPVVRREDGADIAWDATGPEDAPAVVLIQGLAYPAAAFFRVVPPLAESYRVLTVDNRGAGRTGLVPGAPYSVETMARDVVAVLDAAGVDRAHVVGVSMGGLMAQELGVSWPDRVRSLLLACTHVGITEADVDPMVLQILRTRPSMTPQQAAEASVPFNYMPTTPRERIEEDWAVRLPLAISPEGYLAQIDGTWPWLARPRTSAITAPTLVVHGDSDRLLPPSNGRMVAEAIPGSRFELIPDANHVFWTDQPEYSVKLILSWLDEQS